jgi:hypothetical protein
VPQEAQPSQTRVPQQNRVLQFFSHPAFGIIGNITSVIGIVLAILFYLQTLQTREWVYTVHHVQSILAQEGTAEDLQIVFKGETAQTMPPKSSLLAQSPHVRKGLRKTGRKSLSWYTSTASCFSV